VRQTALARVAAALGAGQGEVPVREMARLAGVSPVTAYRLLGHKIKT
jgi:DNA-binding IclR family transcriptional regulator